VTGGAKVLADTLIGRFGKERAPFALGVASLLFGFPIFFDAGLVVMMPIILSVAARFGLFQLGTLALTYLVCTRAKNSISHYLKPSLMAKRWWMSATHQNLARL